MYVDCLACKRTAILDVAVVLPRVAVTGMAEWAALRSLIPGIAAAPRRGFLWRADQTNLGCHSSGDA